MGELWLGGWHRGKEQQRPRAHLKEQLHCRHQHAVQLTVAVLVHDGQVPAGRRVDDGDITACSEVWRLPTTVEHPRE